MNIVGKAVGGIYQVMRGLKTVAQHTFKPPTTGQYPDVMPDLPATFRGRLALTVNPESGEHLCISCRQCERVCPDKCIEITAHKSPETNKLELIDFRIDHGLCMFCGLCTEVCPTDCIINTQDFEMSDYSRSALIYDLKKLTLSQEESAYYFEKKELKLPKPKPVKPAPTAGTASGAASSVAPTSTPPAPAAGTTGVAATTSSSTSSTTSAQATATELTKTSANGSTVAAAKPKPTEVSESTVDADAKSVTSEAKAPEAKPEPGSTKDDQKDGQADTTNNK